MCRGMKPGGFILIGSASIYVHITKQNVYFTYQFIYPISSTADQPAPSYHTVFKSITLNLRTISAGLQVDPLIYPC